MNYTDITTGTTASSWGWSDADGNPALRADAEFQKWSVRTSGYEGRLGFLTLPVDTDGDVVLLLACDMVRRLT